MVAAGKSSRRVVSLSKIPSAHMSAPIQVIMETEMIISNQRFGGNSSKIFHFSIPTQMESDFDKISGANSPCSLCATPRAGSDDAVLQECFTFPPLTLLPSHEKG